MLRSFLKYIASIVSALSILSLLTGVAPETWLEIPRLIGGAWKNITALLFGWADIFPQLHYTASERDTLIAFGSLIFTINHHDAVVARTYKEKGSNDPAKNIVMIGGILFPIIFFSMVIYSGASQNYDSHFNSDVLLGLILVVLGFHALAAYNGSRPSRVIIVLLFLLLTTEGMRMVPEVIGPTVENALEWLRDNQYPGD